MAVTERRIMQINQGKWDDMIALEVEWNALEERLGYVSPKRWTRSLAGPIGFMNLIWERDWESVAASEEAYARLFTNPECKNLLEKTEDCVSDMSNEFYNIVEV